MFSNAHHPTTFPPAQPSRPNPQPPFFVPAPSRLMTHQCAAYNTCSFIHPNNFTSPIPASPNQPLTTLLLSLPLARKIHYLILTSRQIESLTRGWFAGSIPLAEVERRMSALEAQYDSLREDVECELESAWVNAGFLPADLTTFPTSSHVPGAAAIRPAVPATGILSASPTMTPAAPKDLKRKGDTASPRPAKKYKSKATGLNATGVAPILMHYSTDRSTDDERGSFALPSSPIGVRACMVPLSLGEKQRMKGFEWADAVRGRKGVRVWKAAIEDSCISPKGGVFKVY